MSPATQVAILCSLLMALYTRWLTQRDQEASRGVWKQLAVRLRIRKE